jgi:hypothetical protein
VVFDTVPLPLAYVGADGTLLGCHVACERFFAVDSVADVLGRPIHDLPLGVVMALGGEHPRVEMRPDRSTPICMVLNELVTKTVKHGAASQSAGSVRVAWSERDGEVTLDWVEAGGPVVRTPDASTGTGMDLMRGLVQHQLGGTLTCEWRSEGFRAQIRFQA